MHRTSLSGWVTVFCGVVLLGVVSCRAEMLGGVEYLSADVPWALVVPNPPETILLPDGRLMSWWTEGKSWESEAFKDPTIVQRAMGSYSSDNGYTWSEPELLFEYPPGEGGWGGGVCLLDRDEVIHLFGLHFFYWDSKKYEGKCLAYHVMSADGGKTWTAPQYCDIGHEYTGDTQSAIQLRSGRILLPLDYIAVEGQWMWGGTVSLSDDGGRTWRAAQRPAFAGQNVEEPNCIELRDGRIWMLTKDGDEHMCESYSSDGGETWSDPQPSRFVGRGAASHFLRLRDGRLVLMWSNCLEPKGSIDPYPGHCRSALAAAISDDDGKTWHGYREIIRTSGPLGPRGWVVHPWMIETADGVIYAIWRQGDAKGPRRARIEPDWLMENSFRDDFSDGLGHWDTRFTEGVTLVPHPNWSTRQVLALRKPKADVAAGASLNFPFGVQGHLTIKLRLEPGFQGARLCLTDYFSRVLYAEDGRFGISLSPTGEISVATAAGEFTPTGIILETGKWHRIRFDWDCEEGSCRLSVNSQHIADLPQLSRAAGICYLRLWSAAEQTDEAGLLVDSVTIGVKG